MKCKYCKKPIALSLFGLRDFCSNECKESYRRAYLAEKKRRERDVNNRGGYISINTPNVNKSNPCIKPIYEDEKSSLRHDEDDFEDYGGLKWYKMAKKYCCNFYIRKKEGYCVTLAVPVQSFKSKCSDCSLGKDLKTYQERKSKNKTPPINKKRRM